MDPVDWYGNSMTVFTSGVCSCRPLAVTDVAKNIIFPSWWLIFQSLYLIVIYNDFYFNPCFAQNKGLAQGYIGHLIYEGNADD